MADTDTDTDTAATTAAPETPVSEAPSQNGAVPTQAPTSMADVRHILGQGMRARVREAAGLFPQPAESPPLEKRRTKPLRVTVLDVPCTGGASRQPRSTVATCGTRFPTMKKASSSPSPSRFDPR